MNCAFIYKQGFFRTPTFFDASTKQQTSSTIPSERQTLWPLAEVIELALGRRALREPPAIVAVVLDHVVLPRPRDALGPQLPVHPRVGVARRRRGVRRDAAAARRLDARGGRVPAVRRDERRGGGPVGLDAAPPCVPQLSSFRRPAPVHPQGLPAPWYGAPAGSWFLNTRTGTPSTDQLWCHRSKRCD